jgi:hypothetical protein
MLRVIGRGWCGGSSNLPAPTKPNLDSERRARLAKHTGNIAADAVQRC